MVRKSSTSDIYPIPTPSERRARRAKVEDCLISGVRHCEIHDKLSKEFGVSPRTIQKDIRLFRSRWDAEARRTGDERRNRVLLALERNAREARENNDRRGELEALKALGRLLGMGLLNVTVNQDNRQQTVNVNNPKTLTAEERHAWLLEFAQAQKELGAGEVEAVVVDVKTNGHETNGHTKNGKK